VTEQVITPEPVDEVAEPSVESTAGPAGARRWLPDLLGLAWVIVAAAVVMAPALFHGWSLGPVDQLNRLGLSQHFIHAAKEPAPHNSQTSDLIREMIPWTTLAWTQVHSGILPLWNPYSGLGGPLAFNWQSAAFSLPALVGYLFPVRLDFTVQVLITMFIAGTGAYVLARVMRLGVLGAAMAATAFELSGSFMTVLGWPIASVMSWAGWLFLLIILIVRGGSRRRHTILFGVVVALAIYAGEPDTLSVLIVAMAVFVLVLLVVRARRLGAKSVARPAVGLALGSTIGLGLSAPLLLPAAQLTVGSIRTTGHHPGYPLYEMLHLLFQTFNGSALAGAGFVAGTGDRFDAEGLGYIATAAYIGVIAVALALVGVARRRRQPAVLGFGVVVVVSACLVYLPPLVSVLNDLPGLGSIRWVRSLQILVLALAVLAGVGLDVVVRSGRTRAVRNWLGAGFGAAALLLLAVWAFGRGHLPPAEASIRTKSFIWPTAEVVIGLAVFGFLLIMDRRGAERPHVQNRLTSDPGRTAGAVLLVASTGLLVALGAPWWSSSTTYLAPTPAEVTLQKAVGSAIVGFGTSACLDRPTMGIQPDVNIVYGVHEFDSYDPLIPKRLFTSWAASTGHYPTPIGPSYAVPVSLFCPAVKTTAAARLFGIGFVLEPAGTKGPPGSVFDRKVGNEGLYRIPGSSTATLTPIGRGGSLPATKAAGKPLKVSYPSPTSWKVVTSATTPQVLRLRLTDVPGWHATIDGQPLALRRFNSSMLQAIIPAGKHTVELHYWPEAFTAGLLIAAVTVIILLSVPVAGRWRRRHRQNPTTSASSSD
jgi:hypothetical protein